MSAGLIVAIVVVVIVVIALVAFAIPRARKAREKRQLEQRRGAVVDRHREVAEDRQARAELAEREAARQRAEADMHQARVRVHERGLADDELRDADDPDEVVSRRETFADRERPVDEPAGEPREDPSGTPVDPATRRPTQS
jgi:flagellar biosynthesis/type III secretory pathway M-ring protein FliF/YscJ